ncbi:MAG TPA: tetratricopeptide repeat protein [Gammaproteobacteria bacterium]|nr:tetratricopeptide repeat protein [Gammaproteobacteria bacterium]
MSLVNQMLRDLEMRREREETAPPSRAEVRAVRIVSGRGRWPLLVGVVAIVAAGAVYAAVVIGGGRHGEIARVNHETTRATAIARTQAPATAATIISRQSSDIPAHTSIAHDSGHPHANPSAEGSGAKSASNSVGANAKAAEPDQATLARTPATPAQRATVAPTPKQKPKPTAHHTTHHTAPAMTKTARPVTPAQRAAAAYAAGVSAAQSGDVAQAEREFNAALAADPTAYGAREALAALLNQQGRMKQAMQLFVTGMRVDPAHRERFARAYARLLVAHNQVAQAVTILKDTLPPATQAPEHYAFLAALQERQGQHQAAVTNYAKALAVQPAQGRWWAGLAVAYDQLREPDKALAAYQRARDAGGLGVTLATYVNQRISALQP